MEAVKLSEKKQMFYVNKKLGKNFKTTQMRYHVMQPGIAKIKNIIPSESCWFLAHI